MKIEIVVENKPGTFMRYILFLLFLLGSTFSFAQKKNTGAPFIRPLPVPHHAVNDFVHFLTLEERTSLELELKEYNLRTGNAIVFISLDSLTDPKTKKQYTIDEVALLYFNKWGIGDSIKNNGVLLMMSKNPRRVRIEVGKGLETSLTNTICQQIIDDKLVPNFKKGTFYQGIKEAVAAIEQHLENPQAAAEQATTSDYSFHEGPVIITQESSVGEALMGGGIVLGIIALIFMWARRQARRFGGWFTGSGFHRHRRGYYNNSFNNTNNYVSSGNDSNWSSNDNSVAAFSSPSFDSSSSSSSSSSSDSFSGGSSDGGGASGSW